MSERTYRLPNGDITNDANEYANEWMKIADRVAEILDCEVHGVDPWISLKSKNKNGMSKVFEIPLSVAFTIISKFEQKETKNV